ncbi:YbjQ family protein [Gammaproteobacteria bacterium]|nr:YbjQ family protein [Gammaproteobacteria bacterium]MDA9258423.1 YbjQ family protein [Gammaproteobacteria bacterium]MDB2666256.1 YbjQ family protein [Gammaproteobacteria bacterium]MDB4843488.1 YbjQ family protein [Gammaproteobacteria bacterium]MDB9842184.1 YbjQ family protein [Gammaproteobacteria bacterium]
MLVSTTPSIEGKRIQTYHGIVTGSTVRARHIGTDILATLKNIVGGELKSYSILLTAAREEAMERMIAKGTEQNANAIINFRFQTSTIAPGASEVIAYGTAVTLSD